MSEELENIASLPRSVTIPPEVLFQEVEDEMVLLNLQSEHYYGLDEMGKRIWQLLAEHQDVATVLERLLVEFDVDEAVLRRDLARLIHELVEAGLATASAD